LASTLSVAKHNEFSWQQTSARHWSALSMCSTNLPSVCIHVTTID
jgi:hypothetical protein